MSRTYRVGEVARIAKVTIRTLHHYDEIGLLQPTGRSRAGYRLYTDEDIERLQHIRFHRELGMALESIREVLDATEFDARQTLLDHRRQLLERKQEAEALIATIDRTLETFEMENDMSAEERFAGFQPEEHAAEAKERWGQTDAYKQSMRRVAQLSEQDWKQIKAEADCIVAEFASCQEAGLAPDSAEARGVAEKHRLHIGRFYDCSPSMHTALAEMYVHDERFAAYYDKHGEGLSGYVSAAILANAEVALGR